MPKAISTLRAHKFAKHLLTTRSLLWIITFACMGAITLLISRAATSSYVIDPTTGSVSGNASVIIDAGASRGSAVKFANTNTGGPTVLPNPGTWTNITGNLANLSASCGNFGGVWPVPNSSALIGGRGEANLYKSATGNNVWTELGTGAGSVKVLNRVGNILFDPNNSNIFYEGGIYGSGGGVYKSTDGGVTIQQLGSVYHVDGLGVDFTDPNRQTLVGGIHEQHQKVFKSTNGGNTWTEIGQNLPSGYGFSQDPAVINSSTYVINTYPSWGGGNPGIFRTTDGGATWVKVSSEYASMPPLITANGTIYYSSSNDLVKSTDQGQTWTAVGSNLRYEFRPAELPDGRLISVDNNNRLVVSGDGGNTWTEFGANIPYSSGFSGGVTYSKVNQAVYIWHTDCGNVILPDAIYQLK